MPRGLLIDSRFTGVRQNLALNPRPAAAVTDWAYSAGTGGAGTLAVVTTAGAGPQGRTGFERTTVTTAPTGGTVGTYYRAPTGGVPGGLVGDHLRLSMWVRPPVACRMRVSGQTRAAGTAVGTPGTGVYFDCPANVWTRLDVTYIADAAYDALQTWAQIENPVTTVLVGQNWDHANVLNEKGDALGVYFDGAMRNAKWNGTANASTSTGNGYAGRT